MESRLQRQLRERNHQQLAELKAASKNVNGQHSSRTPDNAIGRISRMEAKEAASVNATTLANYLQRQRQTAARLRLEHNAGFGYCAECGEPTATDRLNLLRHARHCIQCAAK